PHPPAPARGDTLARAPAGALTDARPRAGNGDRTMTLTRTQVHPSELMAALAAGTAPRVLDVRTPAEFETVHIPGSYNVPLDTLREHREELGSHLEDEVVLVCRSGNRAEQAERLL